MKSFNPVILASAALGALTLGACATQRDIAEAIAPVDAQTQANSMAIGQQQEALASTRGQVMALTGEMTEISATAREALDRATRAGVLAEGKFLYSVMLTDDSVKFPTNSSELSPEAMARLDELAARLRDANRNVYLEIQGYTDATGSPDVNARLGQERAEAVRRYLSRQGVPLNRISTISYGEESPIADNNSREGRAQNRRVVIQVLS